MRSPRSTLIIGISVLLISAVPFLAIVAGVPQSHDLADHVAMGAMVRDGFAEGVFYPRWFGGFNLGWGEPTGVFYPPGLATVTALSSYLFGGSTLAGLVFASWLFTVVGVLGIFLLVRPVAGVGGGVVAASMFALAPFRTFEMYASGLFSSYAAGCLIPWLLLSFWRLSQSIERHRTVLWGCAAALSFGAITLVNLPCALIAAYLIGAWALVEAIATRKFDVPLRLLVPGILGGALAAVYVLPAVLEQPHVKPHHADDGPLYATHFVFQRGGKWTSEYLFNFLAESAASQFALLIVGGALFWVVSRSRSSVEKTNATTERAAWCRLLVTYGTFSFLLCTPLSLWFWNTAPFLHKVNLPWRLLDHVALAGALLGGAGLVYAWKHCETWRRWSLAASGVLTLVALGYFGKLDYFILTSRQYVAFDSGPKLLESYCSRDGYFLPAAAMKASRLHEHPIVWLDGPANGRVLWWSHHRRLLEVVAQSPTRIGLRTFMYPGWSAKILGRTGEAPLPLETGKETGRIEFDVPAGTHRVELSFTGTPLRSTAASVSFLTLVSLILAASWASRRAKRTVAAPKAKVTSESPEPLATVAATD